MSAQSHPDHQLEPKRLRASVLVMADLVDEQLDLALRAIDEGERHLARIVHDSDVEVERYRHGIERDCITLLVREQPTGSDLRTVVVAFAVAIALERIGSLAADLARYATTPNITTETRRDLVACGERSQDLLGGAMAAYAAADSERAEGVLRSDDRLGECADGLLRRTISGVLDTDTRTSEARTAEHVWVSLAVRDIERIGEHARSIAERVGETDTVVAGGR